MSVRDHLVERNCRRAILLNRPPRRYGPRPDDPIGDWGTDGGNQR